MSPIKALYRRLVSLEENQTEATEQKVTVEKCGGLELVKWGNLIVKMLKGGSMDDL